MEAADLLESPLRVRLMVRLRVRVSPDLLESPRSLEFGLSDDSLLAQQRDLVKVTVRVRVRVGVEVRGEG